MIAESSSSRKRAIVWFRKDLRLADHPALDAALQGHGIPVLFGTREGGAWSPGQRHAGGSIMLSPTSINPSEPRQQTRS